MYIIHWECEVLKWIAKCIIYWRKFDTNRFKVHFTIAIDCEILTCFIRVWKCEIEWSSKLFNETKDNFRSEDPIKFYPNAASAKKFPSFIPSISYIGNLKMKELHRLITWYEIHGKKKDFISFEWEVKNFFLSENIEYRANN